MKEIRVSTEIEAAPGRVFAFVSDHERFLTGGALSCSLAVEGATTRDGVGAVRVVTSEGVELREEITAFDPGRGYEYVIRSLTGPFGLRIPIAHQRGWIELTPDGDRTTVLWGSRFRVDMVIGGSLFEGPLASQLETTFGQLLERARRVVEAG